MLPRLRIRIQRLYLPSGLHLMGTVELFNTVEDSMQMYRFVTQADGNEFETYSDVYTRCAVFICRAAVPQRLLTDMAATGV